MADLLHR